jgi:predicted O-methyltransferase YrrM
MAGKIEKGIKGLLLMLKYPSALQRIYLDENVHRNEVIAKYNLPQGLPVVDITDLLKEIDERISPFSSLEGSSSPMDMVLLKGLAKRFPEGEYFEIGTWRGESVVNVADTGINCTTLNLSDQQMRERNISEKIIALHGFYSKRNPSIRHVYGDSRTFDFKSLNKKFDLIFIDGDHNFEFVKNDTTKMFELLRDEHSIIVWHDYGNTQEDIRWDILHGILESTPEPFRKNLYRVSNTMCAIFTRENIRSYFSEFPQTPRHNFEVQVKKPG